MLSANFTKAMVLGFTRASTGIGVQIALERAIRKINPELVDIQFVSVVSKEDAKEHLLKIGKVIGVTLLISLVAAVMASLVAGTVEHQLFAEASEEVIETLEA